jgi:hypothetical protein
MTLNQKASLKILKKMTEQKFVSVAVWNKNKEKKNGRLGSK